MESVVALNILKNTVKNGEIVSYEVINPKSDPILFYSNSDKSLSDELMKNEQLEGVLKELKVFDSLSYSNTSISGVKFDIASHLYSNVNIDIQDLYPLNYIDNGMEISTKIIEYVLMPMYNKSLGDPTFICDDSAKNVKTIFNHLQNVYSTDFNVDDIAKYLKDRLVKSSHLNEQNTEYVYTIFFRLVE